MSVKGVDLEMLRMLVGQIMGTKADVEAVIRDLERELQSLTWSGPDRERFVSEWHQHVAQLRLLTSALDTVASEATRHGDRQAAISGGGGW